MLATSLHLPVGYPDRHSEHTFPSTKPIPARGSGVRPRWNNRHASLSKYNGRDSSTSQRSRGLIGGYSACRSNLTHAKSTGWKAPATGISLSSILSCSSRAWVSTSGYSDRRVGVRRQQLKMLLYRDRPAYLKSTIYPPLQTCTGLRLGARGM